MKKYFFATVLFFSMSVVRADDKGDKCDFSLGADVVSSYLWRGTAYSGASIQPSMGLNVGGFSIGAWGSVDFAGFGFKEVDLTASYTFGNFTVGLFNLWPGWEGDYNYFDFSKSTVHILEANLLYSFDPFPLTLGWNTIIAGDDKYMNNHGKMKRAYSTYVEATYSFSVKDVTLDLAVGASLWNSSVLYTSDLYGWRQGTDGFAVVYTSLMASKNIKITDSYSLPVYTQLAYNPAKEDAFLVFGIRF